MDIVDQCLRKDAKERPDISLVVEALSAQLEGATGDRPRRRNPFRGLLPFDERHASSFFGRQAEVDRFGERLREEPVLPVVGPSGAGKSSFVQAGVIPRLREQGPLRVLRLRPGRRPIESLAARLVAIEHGSLTGSRVSSGLTTRRKEGADEAVVRP